jgi:ABC-type transport system involved in cytochrome c biogenesis ATPase subunit
MITGPCKLLAGVGASGIPGEPRLRSVDLEVDRGQLIAVVGPLGSGVGTLLRVLAGRHVADEGTVGVPREEDVFFLPRAPVFGDGVVVSDLAEGLRLDVEAYGQEIAELGLEKLRSRTLGDLPAELRARVGLAAALASPAGLLVLEEPADAVDVACWDIFGERLQARLAAGVVVVLGTRRGEVPCGAPLVAVGLAGGEVLARAPSGEVDAAALGAWYRARLDEAP